MRIPKNRLKGYRPLWLGTAWALLIWRTSHWLPLTGLFVALLRMAHLRRLARQARKAKIVPLYRDQNLLRKR